MPARQPDCISVFAKRLKIAEKNLEIRSMLENSLGTLIMKVLHSIAALTARYEAPNMRLLI